MMLSKQVKKGIGILSLACFLSMPVGYTVSSASAAPAPQANQQQYVDQKVPNNDKDKNVNIKDNKVQQPKVEQQNNKNDIKDNKDKTPAPAQNENKKVEQKAEPAPQNDKKVEKNNKKDTVKEDKKSDVVSEVVGAVLKK